MDVTHEMNNLRLSMYQPTNVNAKSTSHGEPVSAHGFYPYTMNGGSVVAISGKDYAVLASDTRLSEGFAIHSRDFPHIYELTPNTILGAVGFQGDVATLVKHIKVRLTTFEQEHNKPLKTGSIAQMLSTMLYHRRFFPFYVYNVLVGLDAEGAGCVYSYDPVGSYEREAYRAGGTSSAILQPILDSLAGGKNRGRDTAQPLDLPLADAQKLAHDAFISAAERDIHVGDAVRVYTITRDGVNFQQFSLRRD